MLQCQKCQQWFHQECIRNPNVSQLLMGDRFYEFVCTLCTGSTEETLNRLPVGWVDALHLILFNLIVSNRKEHHDLDTAIIPLLKKKLKIFACPSSVLKSSRIEPNFIESLLKGNKSKFKCGSKSSKKTRYWTLVKVGPPLAPHNKIYQKDSSVIDVNFKSKHNNAANGTSTSTNAGNSQDNLFNLNQRRPALKSAENGKSVTLKLTKKSSFKNKFNTFKDSIHTANSKNFAKEFSNEASSRTNKWSSLGTLDTFIPRPKDFLGLNNPFRTEVPGGVSDSDYTPSFLRPPCLTKRKRKWSPPSLGSAGSSPHSSISSLSSASDHPSTINNNKFEDVCGSGNISGNSSSSESTNLDTWKNNENSSSSASPNSSSVKHLKWSINSYFEADSRMARGEKFQVIAKRQDCKGHEQHLVAWKDPITKPFLSPTTSSRNNEDSSS